MIRRHVRMLCFAVVTLAVAAAANVWDPAFAIRQGMSYEDVKAILGEQSHGICPRSVDDGSWTGTWAGANKFVRVNFDHRDRVRESPNLARRVLRSEEHTSELQSRRDLV